MGTIDHSVLKLQLLPGAGVNVALGTNHISMERVIDNATGASVGDALPYKFDDGSSEGQLRLGQLIHTVGRVVKYGWRIENPTLFTLDLEIGYGLGDFEDFSNLIRDAVPVTIAAEQQVQIVGGSDPTQKCTIIQHDGEPLNKHQLAVDPAVDLGQLTNATLISESDPGAEYFSWQNGATVTNSFTSITFTTGGARHEWYGGSLFCDGLGGGLIRVRFTLGDNGPSPTFGPAIWSEILGPGQVHAQMPERVRTFLDGTNEPVLGCRIDTVQGTPVFNALEWVLMAHKLDTE